jgi:hypothetical protein
MRKVDKYGWKDAAIEKKMLLVACSSTAAPRSGDAGEPRASGYRFRLQCSNELPVRVLVQLPVRVARRCQENAFAAGEGPGSHASGGCRPTTLVTISKDSSTLD